MSAGAEVLLTILIALVVYWLLGKGLEAERNWASRNEEALPARLLGDDYWRAKSMKPRSTSVCTSSTRTRSPTSRPRSPRTTRPSAAGWTIRTQVPFGDAPVTTASKRSPSARGEQQGRRGLADLPLDLRRVVLLQGAVARQLRELLRRVGTRRPRERGLDEALRGEVRETAVRGGGVRVVLHREAEVPVRRPAGELHRVLARAQSFTTESDTSANRAGSACRRRTRNSWSAGALGSAGSRSPRPAASSTMRPHRSGERRTRRSEGKPGLEELRGRDVGRDHEILDQVLGRVLLVRAQVRKEVADEDGTRLRRLEGQRAAVVAQLLHGERHARLQAELLGDRGLRGHGRGAFPSRRARRRPSRRRASPGSGRARGDVRLRHHAVGRNHHLDDDREPIPPLPQRRQVGGEPLGQHGEDLGRGVDRGRVRPRVAVDRAAVRDGGVHVGHGHQELHGARGEGLRHGELVEVPRVVVVDRHPGKAPQVADSRARRDGALGERRRLREGRGGEIGLQAALDHGPAGDRAQSVTSGGSVRAHRSRAP